MHFVSSANRMLFLSSDNTADDFLAEKKYFLVLSNRLFENALKQVMQAPKCDYETNSTKTRG